MKWVESKAPNPDYTHWELQHLLSGARIMVTHCTEYGYSFGSSRKKYESLVDVQKAAIKNMVATLKKDLKALTL